jgi:type II secretory pathway pseudopilin PulG
MTLPGIIHNRTARSVRGMSITELMVAVLIGVIALAVVGMLSLYGLRSFVAMGNYTDLDSKSRQAIDLMSREMRQATFVNGFQTNLPTKWLELVNTNAPATTYRYVWDSVARTLTCQQTGRPIVTNLTECDGWDFALYQRTPVPNSTNTFYPATNITGTLDKTLCKLIDMTWKCSRTMLGKKVNTESVQTAQIVLRNKQ